MTVILAYLLYTLYEADYIIRQSGDFYKDLGLWPGAEEKAIKSRFRRLYAITESWMDPVAFANCYDRAAVHHPDKFSTEDTVAHAAAEAYFVNLKTAQDTLSDPIKRFAYERFGPDMLKWQHCKTMRDYLLTGIQSSSLPIYAGSVIAFGLLAFTSYLQWGRFWRYSTFVGLFILEYHTITRPFSSPILTKLLNPFLSTFTWHSPLLPFQLVSLARKATFTLFIALSQLSGLFPQPQSKTTTPSSEYDQQQLVRLEGVAMAHEVEATRLLAMDMTPFANDEAGKKDLRDRIREWLVNNTIRSDPEVRDAMGRAITKRRSGAPPGAR